MAAPAKAAAKVSAIKPAIIGVLERRLSSMSGTGTGMRILTAAGPIWGSAPGSRIEAAISPAARLLSGLDRAQTSPRWLSAGKARRRGDQGSNSISLQRTVRSVPLLRNWRAGRRFDARDPIEVCDQARQQGDSSPASSSVKSRSASRLPRSKAATASGRRASATSVNVMRLLRPSAGSGAR